MKLIAEYYAKVWIAVLLALSVIGLFSNITFQNQQGLPALLGNIVETALSIKHEKTEVAFDTYMEHILPEIYWKEDYKIVVGREVNVQECFGARDRVGAEVPVSVESAWNKEGECINFILSSNETFCIEEPGRYWLMLSATDSDGFQKEIIVQIFLNRM